MGKCKTLEMFLTSVGSLTWDLWETSSLGTNTIRMAIQFGSGLKLAEPISGIKGAYS